MDWNSICKAAIRAANKTKFENNALRDKTRRTRARRRAKFSLQNVFGFFPPLLFVSQYTVWTKKRKWKCNVIQIYNACLKFAMQKEWGYPRSTY